MPAIVRYNRGTKNGRKAAAATRIQIFLTRPSTLLACLLAAIVVALARSAQYPSVRGEVEVEPMNSATAVRLQVYKEDDKIDPEKESERCKRYGLLYDGRITRRRIFYGSLVGDDSMFTLRTIAAELYGLCHTVSLVESNTTFQLTPRKIRFPLESENWNVLVKSGLFGPDTVVNIDYYVDDEDPPHNGMHRQHLQRQRILERWRQNGMGPEDIAMLTDTDETFTRDFFRAMQICDVPQFRPGQDCQKPKLTGSTLIFESSPECVVSHKDRAWFHPDLIIGECVDLIGDDKVHKPPKRTYKEIHSWRQAGYGGKGPEDYELYFKNFTVQRDGKKMYPLWNGADFRRTEGGNQYRLIGEEGVRLHTAYHFHNFFETIDEIRHKYKTYGAFVAKADTLPVEEIHGDLGFAFQCARGNATSPTQTKRVRFGDIVGPRPIYFEDDFAREGRHEHWKELVNQTVEK